VPVVVSVGGPSAERDPASVVATKKHFSFEPDRELSECQTVSDVVLIAGGGLFQADGPATEKLCGSKPAVLVRGTTRSP